MPHSLSKEEDIVQLEFWHSDAVRLVVVLMHVLYDLYALEARYNTHSLSHSLYVAIGGFPL